MRNKSRIDTRVSTRKNGRIRGHSSDAKKFRKGRGHEIYSHATAVTALLSAWGFNTTVRRNSRTGLGAKLRKDAIYPLELRHDTGKPLDGANRYTIYFDKGATSAPESPVHYPP
jgi:hypothetical protein